MARDLKDLKALLDLWVQPVREVELVRKAQLVQRVLWDQQVQRVETAHVVLKALKVTQAPRVRLALLVVLHL